MKWNSSKHVIGQSFDTASLAQTEEEASLTYTEGNMKLSDKHPSPAVPFCDKGQMDIEKVSSPK